MAFVSMCKITDKLDKQIDLHVIFHHAGIVNEAQKARDEIAGIVNFYIRSLGQQRRWYFVRQIKGEVK